SIVSDKDERPEDEATAGDASGGSTGATGSDDGSSGEPGSESGSEGESGGPDRMDLPKWNRARVKRKQVKGEEQDGFQAGIRKAGKTAMTQAPVVIGAIVVVAGIIAGVVWYRGSIAEDAAEATRILASATAASSRARIDATGEYDDRKLPPPNPVFADESARAKSIDATLNELSDQLSDTDAATAASLVEAARHMQGGKFSEAKAGYESFLQAQSDHPLAFLAHEGLALALEAAGDVDGAVAQLDTMAPVAGTFYRDQALFHKARMLEGQGKADEALTAYKAYAQEYPLEKDSLARDAVVTRLEELAPDLVPAEAKKNAAGLGGMGLPPGLGG
ncbi:MAG: tetratricopeptide repeat protein, partial [Nannocystaceae bacterium]|nr:tetratricopeptide repeat protein [Nannocystaceae bacterium]